MLLDELMQLISKKTGNYINQSALAESLGITSVNLTEAQSIMDKAVSSLTVVDKKYILCFLSGESVKNIAARFNVEPASVYTVRYRLRKKFPGNVVLPF